MEPLPTESLFNPATHIHDKHGRGYRVEALTPDLAGRHAEALVRLHSLIPLVDPWTPADLMSEGTPERPFRAKWMLSGVVRTAGDNAIVGVLIAFLRTSSRFHPLDAVYVHRIAVAPAFQRQGVGSALLAAFQERAFGAIPWLMNITVQVSRDRPDGDVEGFYGAAGFSRILDVPYPNKTDSLLVCTRGAHRSNRDISLLQHPRLAPDCQGSKVYISTTNERKAGELRHLFACYNISVGFARRPIELTEPQIEGSNPSIDVELVHHPLRLAARFLENRTSLPFLVEDTMLYIEFFNKDYDAMAELPGYDTKRWWKQLGVEGVLNLMGSTTKRRARYVSQIGAYTGKGRYIVGRGEVLGTIAPASRVSDAAVLHAPMTSPWFFHSIFEPAGSRNTLAEMDVTEFAEYDYKRRAVEDFLPKLDFTNDSQLLLPYAEFEQ